MTEIVDIRKVLKLLNDKFEKDSHMYFNYWNSSDKLLYFSIERSKRYEKEFKKLKILHYKFDDSTIHNILHKYFIEFLNYYFPRFSEEGYRIMFDHPKSDGFREIKGLTPQKTYFGTILNM